MHQICDFAKYHEFMLYVVTFEPIKIPTLSATQNNHPNLFFCKRYKYQCSYFNWLQSCDLKRKFMTFRPVANLMHHPICCNFFMDRWPLVTVHKSEETIQGRKLFKGGNNIVMQLYNCTTILWNSDPLHIFQSMAAKKAGSFTFNFVAIGWKRVRISSYRCTIVRRCDGRIYKSCMYYYSLDSR